MSEVTIYKWIKLHSLFEGTGISEAGVAGSEGKPSLETRGRYSKKSYDHIRAKMEGQELIDQIMKESEHHPVQLMCSF